MKLFTISILTLLGLAGIKNVENNSITTSKYLDMKNLVESIGFDYNQVLFKEAKDLKGNEYIIGEQDKGYFIYSKELKAFMEYSKTSYSPYLNYSNNLIYASLANYYVETDNKYISLLDNKEYLKEDFNQISAVANYDCSIDCKNEIALTSNYMFEYKVKHSEFFSEETSLNCGYIEGGYCGFIGLGLLIGYQDKYINDNIMDDSYYYSSNKTGLKNGNNSLSQYLYNLNPKSSTTSKHINKVMQQYANARNISINYKSKWTPFFSAATIYNAIKNDTPVELFGNYTYIKDSNKNKVNSHAIVAYEAYVNTDLDTTQCAYRCHLGWRDYSDVTVSSYVIGSIYYFTC